jgi:thymidylate synthase
MKIIKANSLGKCWRECLLVVYREGKILDDDKGKIKELLDLVITIKNIDEDRFVKIHGDKSMIKWMKNNFDKKIPIASWEYSYGGRIYDFQGVNQMSAMIQKLRKNPSSKSATISLMLPPQDNRHIPCLAALDFKVRNKKLITTAFFRSQDVGKKLYADALALKNIADKIAKAINKQTGEFVIFIKSAHFYLKDLNQLKDVLDHEL